MWIVREHRKMSACETALVSEPGNRSEHERGFVGEHRKVTAHETANDGRSGHRAGARRSFVRDHRKMSSHEGTQVIGSEVAEPSTQVERARASKDARA